MASAHAPKPDPRKTGKKEVVVQKPSPAFVAAVLNAHNSVIDAFEHDDSTAQSDQRLLHAGHDALQALRAIAVDETLWEALRTGAKRPMDVEVLATYAREALPWLLVKAKYREPPEAEELVHEALGALRAAQAASPVERARRLTHARERLADLTARTHHTLHSYERTTRSARRPGKRLRQVVAGLGGLTAAVGGALLGLGGVELAQAALDPALGEAATTSLQAAGEFAAVALVPIVERRFRGTEHAPGLAAEVEALRIELHALEEALDDAPPDTAILWADRLADRLDTHQAGAAARAVTRAAKARLEGHRADAKEHLDDARVEIAHVLERLFRTRSRPRGD